MNLGKLGVWFFLDPLNSSQSAETAKKIEKLGYSALWLPEAVGKNPMVLASWLLANTEKLVVATGIANIYNREPGATLSAQHTLAEQSDGRFLLGLGVSHKPLVEGVRGLKYGPPIQTMKDYLEKMKSSPYMALTHSEAPPTVIAALGPKMLELAGNIVMEPTLIFPRQTTRKLQDQSWGQTPGSVSNKKSFWRKTPLKPGI